MLEVNFVEEEIIPTSTCYIKPKNAKEPTCKIMTSPSIELVETDSCQQYKKRVEERSTNSRWKIISNFFSGSVQCGSKG